MHAKLTRNMLAIIYFMCNGEHRTSNFIPAAVLGLASRGLVTIDNRGMYLTDSGWQVMYTTDWRAALVDLALQPMRREDADA